MIQTINKVILLLTFYISICFSQELNIREHHKPDIYPSNLKGNIHTIIESECQRDPSSMVNNLSKCQEIHTTYDSLGRVIEQQTYDVALLNDTNRLIVHLEDRVTFKYNSNNQIIEMADYNRKNKITDRETYRYDELGNIVERIDYDDDGDIDRKTIWFYTNGILQKTVNYDDDDKPENSGSRGFEFDKKGNWIKYQKVNNMSIKTYTRKIKYYSNKEKE